ncbi:MAG TPA: DUF397 domain-containing protein [Gemmatimonadales bacterium]|nr:DUF397 domain-containing protein [Gemmatimonadales bacterium]
MDLSNAHWRKATRTTNNGGACVELAAFSEAVAVRDSKDPEGPHLAFAPREWSSLLTRVKSGDLDL